MIVFPNCKINLGLHILAKRADGFHDLETVFYPIPFHDALEIIQQPDATRETELRVTGINIDTPTRDNICYKAWSLLKKDFPQLPAVNIHLHKLIPTGAGLGGGSADGAFTILLLNHKFGLKLSENQMVHYALQLGSDCPFFVRNRPCLARGRGEIMEDIGIDLSFFRIVLVNPGIHVPTGWAFSMIRPQSARPGLKELLDRPVTEWRGQVKNDFEAAVFEKFPAIATIRNQLYEAGAIYASMSGSGSTVYGLFEKTAVPSFSFPPEYLVKIC